MLAALVAVLIPIIIEWLFRKRKRQVELPTIRFLLRNKEQEKIRRQDRLLLILRMVALFLLVLAIARPIIRHGWIGGVRQRNVIILLDGTASMNQQVGVTTAFGWAQKKAAGMIRELPPGTTVTVGFLGDRAETLFENAADIHTAAGRVDALRAGSGAAPMSEGVQWLKDALERSKKAGTEIYLFSDFQKSTWITSKTPAPDLAKAINTVGGGNELYMVDVGNRDLKYNYMVTDLRPVEWALSARMPVTFTVTVDSTGQPPEGAMATVKFFVNDLNAPPAETDTAKTETKDGKKEAESVKKNLKEIPMGNGPKHLTFDYMFPGPGEYKIEVTIEKDDHSIDNSRVYLCHVPEDLRVLILDETVDSPMPDSIYLARAVAPSSRPGMAKVSRFAVKTVHPSRIVFENLGEYVAVILSGSSFIREDMVSKLERYVGDGGSLWIFMGDGINPYDYNKFLYKEGKGLIPCRLDTKNTGAKDVHVDIDSLKVSGEVPGKKSNPDATVSDYFRFAMKTDGADLDSNVLLKLSNNDPAILEKNYGRGKVLVSSFTVGPKWTFLPALIEFPGLVQEILRYLVGNPSQRSNLSVGDPFVEPVFVSSQHLLLRYPDGSRVRLTPRQRGTVQDAWEVDFRGTTQQGLYEFVDVVQEVLARRRFVVNQSSAEGDLTRLKSDTFQDAFGSGGWKWIGPETALEDFVASLHAITEVAPGILWALVGVLAVESFLAARFGRRRGGSVA